MSFKQCVNLNYKHRAVAIEHEIKNNNKHNI
jgi:hypothetical protein